jgi:fatty-acid desaturase
VVGRAHRVLLGGPRAVALLHHVTWSINSICHMIGDAPFAARDHSRNVWPLAVMSFGESWHNLHHADPRARGTACSAARSTSPRG